MALILVFAHYSRWLSFARALLAETRETRVCAAMPIRVARAAARRYSSHAPLAPRFATTLNYTTSDMIQLAQSDEAAAVRGFWQPLRDYRSLMRSLSERHAREELGLDGEAALAAAIRVESADQRRTRLASPARPLHAPPRPPPPSRSSGSTPPPSSSSCARAPSRR